MHRSLIKEKPSIVRGFLFVITKMPIYNIHTYT